MVINNKIQNLLISVALLGAVVSFSVFLNFGAMISQDGLMNSCPFNSNNSLCSMDFQEHINLWKLMFVATPQKAVVVFMLLALWVSVAVLIFKNFLLKHSKLLFYNYCLYKKQYAYISLVDPLKQALYQGLINPKIF